MLTGRVVRGAFTRIASLATAGTKSLIRRAPRMKMDIDSISLGRILGNPRRGMNVSSWGAPSLSAMRHMQTLGAFGSSPSTATRYTTGTTFVSFAKKSGLQANHLSTDGLSLALFKGRHTNLI